MRKPTLLEALLAQARPEMLIGAAAGLVLLGASAGYLYGIKPRLAEYRTLVAEHEGASLQFNLEPPGPEPDAIAQMEERIARDREQLYGSSATVTAREMQSFVIDTLQEVSSTHATRLTSVTPGMPNSVLMFDELPYDVTLTGSYEQLFGWLWQAESALRPMVVKSFEMRPAAAEEVELRLRLVAYRAKDLPS